MSIVMTFQELYSLLLEVFLTADAHSFIKGCWFCSSTTTVRGQKMHALTGPFLILRAVPCEGLFKRRQSLFAL